MTKPGRAKMTDSLKFAYEEIDRLINDFRDKYPGPYLDLGTKGMTLKALIDCRERLANIL